MWWFSRILGLLVLSAAIPGCGLQPIYGDRTGDAVLTRLAAIEISPMRGLVGVEMYNHLRDSLSPSGQPVSPTYQLQLEFQTYRVALITDSDSQVRRFNLVVATTYNLFEIESGSLLDSGSSRVVTSYNVIKTNNFGTSIAEQEAQLRGIRQASRQIVWTLTVFFKQLLSDTTQNYENRGTTS